MADPQTPQAATSKRNWKQQMNGSMIVAVVAILIAIITYWKSPSKSEITAAKQAYSSAATMVADTANNLRLQVSTMGTKIVDSVNGALEQYVSFTDMFGNVERPQYISAINLWLYRDSVGVYHLDTQAEPPETTRTQIPIYYLIAAAGRPIQPVLTKLDTIIAEDDPSWVKYTYTYILPDPGTVVASTSPTPQVQPGITQQTVATTPIAAKDKAAKKKRDTIF